MVHPGSPIGSPALIPSSGSTVRQIGWVGVGAMLSQPVNQGRGKSRSWQEAETGAGWPEGKPGGWAVSALRLKEQAPTSTQAVKVATL